MNLSGIGKGEITTVHSAIAATTTSAEVDVTGFSAVLIDVVIAGTGTWKTDLQGSFNTAGTFKNIYDNNDNQLTTGNLTASRMKLFAPVPNFIKVVATEIDGTATCTVKIQPINI